MSFLTPPTLFKLQISDSLASICWAILETNFGWLLGILDFFQPYLHGHRVYILISTRGTNNVVENKSVKPMGLASKIKKTQTPGYIRMLWLVT